MNLEQMYNLVTALNKTRALIASGTIKAISEAEIPGCGNLTHRDIFTIHQYAATALTDGLRVYPHQPL